MILCVYVCVCVCAAMCVPAHMGMLTHTNWQSLFQLVVKGKTLQLVFMSDELSKCGLLFHGTFSSLLVKATLRQ